MSPMPRGSRHNELLRRAVYACAAANAMHLSDSEVTLAFDRLRQLAGDHDPNDTEHVLADVARSYGCRYVERDPND